MKCILLAQDRENFLFREVPRIFCTADEPLADQGTLCYMEFVINVRPTFLEPCAWKSY